MRNEKNSLSVSNDLFLLVIFGYLFNTKAMEKDTSNIVILLWDNPRQTPELDDERTDVVFKIVS